MNRNFILNIFVIFISFVFGFLGIEMLYRAYLNFKSPNLFFNSSDIGNIKDIWFFQDSPWVFSKKFGYEYKVGKVSGGSIQNNKISSCWDWETNKRGNSGTIKGDYEKSDLKILIFGDSWTAQKRLNKSGESITWPNILQQKLSQKLNKKVHVVNFGRDGYGAIQMFDLAKIKIPEWKPDLVIFAFITDDFTRDRFWRTKTIVNGKTRILTTDRPIANPVYKQSSDTAIIEPKAKKDWCVSNINKNIDVDPIFNSLKNSKLEAIRNGQTTISFWDFSQSTVLNKILYKSALNVKKKQNTQNPRIFFSDYIKDKEMSDAIKSINKTKIPFQLIHFAIYDEMKKNVEYIGSPQIELLIKSLEKLTKKKMLHTLNLTSSPIKNPERFSGSFPDDHHPSMEGLIFYADIVKNAIERYNVLN